MEKVEPIQLGRPTFRYVDIGAVDGTTHRVVNPTAVPAEAAPGRARQLLRTGDTVFSTVRPYLEKIALIDPSLDGEIASTGFCVLRPDPALIDPRFLFRFMTSRNLLDQVLHLQRGVSYPAVRDRDVLAASVPLPPLDEQQRIVDILEDHLSRLDAAVDCLNAALARLDLHHSAQLSTLAPEDVETATLAGLSRSSGYGTSTKCVVGGPGVPVVRIPNLLDGAIDLGDEKRAEDPNVDLSPLMLEPGDLLFVRTNGSLELIGRTSVVQPGVFASFASYLIRYQLDPTRARPEWVHLMLARPRNRSRIEALAASSAGQYNLSIGKLNQLEIPLPSIREQGALVAAFQEQESDRRRLRMAMKKEVRRTGRLRRALLAAAFSGRLTGNACELEPVEELSG